MVLAVYTILVATHRGEFWPFSIYPMFSQAGHPWTRVVVRVVPDNPEVLSWQTVPLSMLPGAPFETARHGLGDNDITSYVTRTETWTPERRRGFHHLFTATHDFNRPLLVFEVRGTLSGDSVSVQTTPLMLLKRDTTHLNPSLARSTMARPKADLTTP